MPKRGLLSCEVTLTLTLITPFYALAAKSDVTKKITHSIYFFKKLSDSIITIKCVIILSGVSPKVCTPNVLCTLGQLLVSEPVASVRDC